MKALFACLLAALGVLGIVAPASAQEAVTKWSDVITKNHIKFE